VVDKSMGVGNSIQASEAMTILHALADIALDVFAAVLHVLYTRVCGARLSRSKPANGRTVRVQLAPRIIGDDRHSPWELWADDEGTGPLASLERGDDGRA